MASKAKHQELVDVMRGVSEQLRKNLQTDGDYEKVWKEHLSSISMREQYSKSMFKLATEVWPECDSRIHWCYDVIKNYLKDGLEKYARRELYLLKRKCDVTVDLDVYLDDISKFRNDKCRVLDVGSCYNPFSEFEDLDVVPLDLTPATENVYKCDFLQLEVVPSTKQTLILLPPPGNLLQLEEGSFHVIVFSLYLSYLPAAEQRFISCEKAWKILKKNGLLLIITPDSKSQHRNSPMMKSWKTALESIGFMRILYEKKTHLHCMAYRKMLHESGQKFAQNLKLMYIPQDFKPLNSPTTAEQKKQCRSIDEDEGIKNAFCELPLCDD